MKTYVRGKASDSDIDSFVSRNNLQAEPASQLNAVGVINDSVTALPSVFAGKLRFAGDDLFIYGRVERCGVRVRGAYSRRSSEVLLIFTQ